MGMDWRTKRGCISHNADMKGSRSIGDKPAVLAADSTFPLGLNNVQALLAVPLMTVDSDSTNIMIIVCEEQKPKQCRVPLLSTWSKTIGLRGWGRGLASAGLLQFEVNEGYSHGARCFNYGGYKCCGD